MSNRVILFLAALVTGACNNEKPTDPDKEQNGNNETPEATCEDDDQCGFLEICEDTECIAGDRDNSYDEATPIRQGEVGDGYISTDGDVDHYLYQTTGPEWIRVDTRVNVEECVQAAPDENDPFESELDTVVEIRAANGALHASMDDAAIDQLGYVFANFDTVLYAYLPTAGDWYITVQDWSSWSDESATLASGDDFHYCLEVKAFTGVTSEEDAIDTPSRSVTLEDGSITVVGALLEEEGDHDYVAVEVDVAQPLYAVGVEAEDVPGSEAVPEVKLHSSEPVLLADKPRLGDDGVLIYFDAEKTAYTLELTDALGGGGANHWFVVHLMSVESDYLTEEVEPNDDSEAPHEVVTEERLTSSSSTPYDYAYIYGTLDPEGDEDFYLTTVDKDEYLSVRCSSDGVGSLGRFAAEFLDAEGNVVASGTEGSDEAPDIENYIAPETGDYLVRLYAEDDSAFGPGAYYSCNFFITTFEAVF